MSTIPVTFPTKKRLLIIDDTPDSIRALLSFLTHANFTVLFAQDGEEGIQTAEYAHPDLILLDVMMPKIDGFIVCERLKTNPHTQDIPILLMSSLTDTVDSVKGLHLGAVDYITKPFDHEEVLMRVQTHLRLCSQKQALKKEICLHASTQKNLQETKHLLEERMKQLHICSTTLARCSSELNSLSEVLFWDVKKAFYNIINIMVMLRKKCTLGFLMDEKLLTKLYFVEKINQDLSKKIAALSLLVNLSKSIKVNLHPIDMPSLIAKIIHQRLAVTLKHYQAIIYLPPVWPRVQSYLPWVEEIWFYYIQYSLQWSEQPHLTLGANAIDDKTLCFWIQSKGHALTPAEQARLFIPLADLHKIGIKDHDIGLTIVRQIVEKLGGQVGVESILNQGNRLYFTLPIINE